MHFYAKFWGVGLNLSIFIAERSVKSVKNGPKITIEKSKGPTHWNADNFERSKILKFRKKGWHHNYGIFQIRTTCFFYPGPPLSPWVSKIEVGSWVVGSCICIGATLPKKDNLRLSVNDFKNIYKFNCLIIVNKQRNTYFS